MTAILLEERADGVLRLTLNRPEARNALSIALMTALIEALGRAADGPRSPGRRHRRRRPRLLRRARSARAARGPGARDLPAGLCAVQRTDAGDRPPAQAGHRRGARGRDGGRLPAGRDLRSGGRRRGGPVCDARGQYRPLLLDADGGADPRGRAQGGDGDAADRRADRRRDGARARARQPGGAAGAGCARRSTGSPGRSPANPPSPSRSARRRSTARPSSISPPPIAMPPRS